MPGSSRQISFLLNGLPKNTGKNSGRYSHTERTANNFRQKDRIPVLVENTIRLSPTVRALKLKSDSPIRFKAGQWLDLHIPLESAVGGYSICSAPFEAYDTNSIQIAIKYVPDTPAQWCHDALPKDRAHIRIGGDFYFEPEEDFSSEHLVFIAGGVGINPIHSIIKQSLYCDNLKTKMKRTYQLLFGAKNEMELLFKTDFVEFATMYSNFNPKFLISREEPFSNNPLVTSGHVTKDDILEAIGHQAASKTKVFVCGPPPMIDFVVTVLNDAGFPSNRLFYEKWW